MKTLKYIPTEASNAEVENNELIYQLNGQIQKFIGNKHINGGIPVILAEGSKIFSEKLKAEKELANNLVGKDKKMSFAKMASMYDTHEELKDLMDNKSDTLSKKTSELMLTKKLAQLDSIFEAQEVQKETTSNNTLKDIINTVDSNASKFKHGGIMKDKYQKGGTVKDKYGMPVVNTPFTIDMFTNKNAPSIPVPGYLKDHPFITTGLSQLSSTYNPNKKTFNYKGDKENADKLIQQYPQHFKNYDDIYNTIEDYQAKSIHLNPDGTYEQTPQAIKDRNEVYNHFTNHSNEDWGYQQFKPFVNKDGIQDIQFTKYNDGHNRRNQMGFLDGQRQPIMEVPTLPTANPLLPLPIKPNNLPQIPKINIPSKTTDPKKPDDYLKDVYQMSAIRDLTDLATLKMKTPSYNYTPQNIAYQRFLPQNTLSAERQFNIQKEQLENSNLPENVKSAYLGDLYAKFQDSNSEVQLQNLRGDNANDNNNVNLYNQITNSNRQEKIQYDDNFRKLSDITEGKYSQEKLRIQDQLINNYSKFKQDKLTRDLLNQMGDGFYYDGSEIKMIPSYKPKNITDPTAQYGNGDTIQKLMKDLNNSTDKDEKLKIAQTIAALKK